MGNDIELTYTVTVRTIGDAAKVRDIVGSRLAKICGLTFNEVVVQDGKYRYEWTPHDHGGIGKTVLVDTVNNARVV